MRSPAWIPAASLVLAAALPALARQEPARQHPAEHYARVLDRPSRDAWQKPDEVIAALDLTPNAVVADIGAGTGYFSRRFAHHAGQVLAVDIDQRLLDIAARGAPANHRTILSAVDDPRLPAKGVDIVFFCNVLHHIDERAAYLKKVAAALKPGGRVVIVDYYKKQLPVGPGVGMKLSEREIISDMARAGLKLVKSLDILPHQYFLIFEPN